jgi:hypothetical protein
MYVFYVKNQICMIFTKKYLKITINVISDKVHSINIFFNKKIK